MKTKNKNKIEELWEQYKETIVFPEDPDCECIDKRIFEQACKELLEWQKKQLNPQSEIEFIKIQILEMYNLIESYKEHPIMPIRLTERLIELVDKYNIINPQSEIDKLKIDLADRWLTIVKESGIEWTELLAIEYIDVELGEIYFKIKELDNETSI
jgi:hypothetical protein